MKMKNAPPKNSPSALINMSNIKPIRTPRQARALQALLQKPVMREQMARVTGASNSPEVVSQLRKLGLLVHCKRLNKRDRDGLPCEPGLYTLVTQSKKLAKVLLAQWNAKQVGAANDE